MVVRELRLSDRSLSPPLREEEMREKLRASGACEPDRVRLTVAGRWLFVDGFVDSLDQKLLAERACRQFAPAWPGGPPARGGGCGGRAPGCSLPVSSTAGTRSCGRRGPAASSPRPALSSSGCGLTTVQAG